MSQSSEEIVILPVENSAQRGSKWRSISMAGRMSERYEKNHSLKMEESVNPKTIWESIMDEYDKKSNEIDEYKQKKQNGKTDNTLQQGSVVEYMENDVFSVLFPAMTKVFTEAVRTDSLTNFQTTFDPLDSIAQNLWNTNPKFPERAVEKLSIHDMPWAQQILKDNPRPHFPKSWIYTPEIAAKTIQSFYRGYLVRKQEDVQEMRQFWKTLKEEMDQKEVCETFSS